MIRKNVIEKIGGVVPLQAYTNDELASLYNVTTKTFLKWLAPFKQDVGEKIGWFYTIRQVNIIFEKLGRPERN